MLVPVYIDYGKGLGTGWARPISPAIQLVDLKTLKLPQPCKARGDLRTAPTSSH